MPTLPVCRACRDGQDFPTAITMAFQPIVDVATRRIYAGEALVRGVDEALPDFLAGDDEGEADTDGNHGAMIAAE